jgi:phosphoenolpyruvate carboxykinase (GTP)
MDPKIRDLLQNVMDEASLSALEALDSEAVHAFVADAVRLCKPASVKVCTDSDEDRAYIRRQAVERGEEMELATEGHTVHFDGFRNNADHDQGRDKANTKYLLPPDLSLGPDVNWTDRDGGLEEVRGYLDGAMDGKEMYVRFFCLGPTDSVFAIPCVQCTDSAYVAHSEDLLYRGGYEELKRRGAGAEFFRFLHSAGRLDERGTSAEVDKRRVYIDILEDQVYSVNTQYGGNTIGLKKLSLRLAIRKADREGWLAEHMFVMGVGGPDDRVTYFTGAFPSACGKTSTAMLPGEQIVGDDIAYLRALDGEARAVNVESGIFGIIRDVNPDDDPVIYDVLTNPGEVIFSNVLVSGGKPYWLGMGEEIPETGINYAGEWHKGMTDDQGKEITPSHKNARYTVEIERLENADPNLHAPDGVTLEGVIYGGRDSDTWVPVKQAFDWAHGIITMGASLESETTAATLGAEGVRKFNLMSNLDFLAIGHGRYIQNNLDFADKVDAVPAVFAVNYFLKEGGKAEGKYLNGMMDKHVWVKWAERRVRGDTGAIEGPTGLLPKHEDLAPLFRELLGKEYTEADYVKQFTIRVPENLAKLDRIEAIYRNVDDTPQVVFDTLAAQRRRLQDLREAKGDYVSPLDL